MAYNETGHARNVANFEELVLVLTTIGVSYNPAVKTIQIGQLNELTAQLKKNLQLINDKNGVYRDKIYARQNAYEQMNSLSMRMVNTMAGLGLDAKLLTQAKSTLAKIRGSSSKKKKDLPANGFPAPRTVSVSQMSFDQRKNNFSILIGLVNAQTEYKPNETDMQIGSLQKYVDTLEILNTEAIQAEQDLTIARQQRDMVLYIENTGALPLTQQIKAYVKGAFSAQSAEYMRVKSIAFNTRKISI